MRLVTRKPNYNVLNMNGWTVLFSYQKPVAAIHQSGRSIEVDTKYSVTTSKHIGVFFRTFGVSRVVPNQKVPQNLLDEVWKI